MNYLASLRSLSLLTLLLTLGCCKKDDPKPVEQLPAATTEGKNTFGCLVNGKVWQAQGEAHMRADWTVPDGLSATMGFTKSINHVGYHYNIDLSFPDTTRFYSLSSGIYRLSVTPRVAFARVSSPDFDYRSDKLYSGWVDITRLDRQAGVMAGTFEFTMVGGPGDTLRVTDGRFDIGNMDR